MLGHSHYIYFPRTILILVVVGCVICDKNSLDAQRLNHIEKSDKYGVRSIRDGSVNSSSVTSSDITTPSGSNGTTFVQASRKDISMLPKPKESKPKLGMLTGGGGGGHGGGGGGHGGGGGQGIGGGEHGGGGGQKRKKKQKKQQALVNRIMPLMIIPFLISTALIPLMLFVIKMLFIKAAIVAKVAVALGLISFFKRRSTSGAVYNHNAWKMR